MKHEQEVVDYIKKNKPIRCDTVFAAFRGKVSRDDIREIWRNKAQTRVKSVDSALAEELASTKAQLSILNKIQQGIQVHKIEPSKSKGAETEATPIIVASDWHIEEEVKKEWVNDLNSYNLDESRKRADTFFRTALRLTQMFGKDVKIKNVVFGFLGDFITNDIHEEMVETALLEPMDAILRAKKYLVSGIEFFLENSDYTLTIICCSGNHARTTDENYSSTESGHSLEYMMYKVMEDQYAGNPRVKFIVNISYHSYLDVLGYKVRFHHGHAIRYGGGIGGLFVPAYKKIDKWNNAMKVDLDIFGHHHQLKDGGSFISNGSMIGYNAYALRGGFSFERPQQLYILIDEKRGRTISAPILFQ